MIDCWDGGFCAAVPFTFVFAHKGVGSGYDICDGNLVRCIIGIHYVRVVYVHIQCNAIVDWLIVEQRWCDIVSVVIGVK